MEHKNNDNDNMPYNSKRAMATAALFTEIFQKYLDRHKCENISSSEELSQFSNEILDHVIIVGGFCRDILLNRSINDIDIIINLRELCKLQTNHLKKYHGKKEDQDKSLRCVYWQRYLKRFNESELNINEQQKHNKEMIAMHNLNYIFNNSFWLNILSMDELLDNKLSIKDVSNHGFASCQIVNTVKYCNVNLDQQCVDFIDTFSLDTRSQNNIFDPDSVVDFGTFHRKSRQLSMSGININIDRQDINESPQHSDYDEDDEDDDELPNKSRPEHNHDNNDNNGQHKDKHGRLKSMAIIEFDIDDLGTDFGNFNQKKKEAQEPAIGSREEYIAIEVPIYSGKVRYKLLQYDFSINTAIMPLSNIVKLKEYNNSYLGDSKDPMTWIEIVENGLGECDAIQDCQINKILKCPETSRENITIDAHPMTFVFWRIIEWMIRDDSFKIDQNLIAQQIRDYKNWLNKEWFDQTKNCKKFMKYLTKILEKECNSLNDINQMVAIMDMLHFNEPFIHLLNNMQNVKHSLMDSISLAKNDNLQNSNIVKIFQQNKYPIEEQVFKIPSKSEVELEKIKVRKQFLEEEITKKNERIEDLEKQNDRLLQEVQYLQELNKKNDRVQELEEQNSKLLQEVQVINESKTKLAVTANNTIDQLRAFLVEYQQAVLAKTNQQ